MGGLSIKRVIKDHKNVTHVLPGLDNAFIEVPNLRRTLFPTLKALPAVTFQISCSCGPPSFRCRHNSWKTALRSKRRLDTVWQERVSKNTNWGHTPGSHISLLCHQIFGWGPQSPPLLWCNEMINVWRDFSSFDDCPVFTELNMVITHYST